MGGEEIVDATHICAVDVRLRALEKERTELARLHGKKTLTLAEFALRMKRSTGRRRRS
jgi:hypothetical protein